MTECMITSLCHQQFTAVNRYDDEADTFDTSTECAASNDQYIGDVISLDDKTFDFQFADGSMAYSLEKKLWNIS